MHVCCVMINDHVYNITVVGEILEARFKMQA